MNYAAAEVLTLKRRSSREGEREEGNCSTGFIQDHTHKGIIFEDGPYQDI